MTCTEPSRQSMSYIFEWPWMSMRSKHELLIYDTNKEDHFKKTVGH